MYLFQSKSWIFNRKNVFGLMSLLLLTLVLPGKVTALQTALIRASDGVVYQIQFHTKDLDRNYGKDDFIRNFSVYDETGEVKLCPDIDDSVTWGLYTAARVLAKTKQRTPVYSKSDLIEAFKQSVENLGYNITTNVAVGVLVDTISESTALHELNVGELLPNAASLIVSAVSIITSFANVEFKLRKVYLAFSLADRYANTAIHLQNLANQHAPNLWDRINAGEIFEVTGQPITIKSDSVEFSEKISLLDPLKLRLIAEVYQSYAEKAAEEGTVLSEDPESSDVLLGFLGISSIIEFIPTTIDAIFTGKDLQSLDESISTRINNKIDHNIIDIYDDAKYDLKWHGFCSPGIDSTFSSFARINEGESTTYTLALRSPPDSTATIAITSNNPDVTFSPALLTFTTNNWYIPQTVRISVARDNDTENEPFSPTYTATGYGPSDSGVSIYREYSNWITDLNILPIPVSTVPHQSLTEDGSATTVDVSQYFSSSNNLTYAAESNPSGIVTTSVSGSRVTITPIAAGVTTVLVRARDTVNTHLTAIQTISVVVRQTSAVIVRPPNNDPTFDVPDNSNPRAEGLREGVSVKVQVTTVLNVRSEPDIHTGEILEQIGNITGIITDGPREADGYTWWKIDWDPINLEGWSAEVIGGKQVLFRRPPDLEISRFDVSSSTVRTGENIELEVRIENNGPGESAETEVYFYYHSGSRNYDLDDLSQETDLRIPGTGKLTVPSLQENRRTTLTLTVDAPETPDRYYYGAFLPSNVHDTDYKGDLTIPMLNNNLAGEKRVQVTGSPDYIVESISVSKTTLDPGQSFTLSATVLNQGIGEPTSSATLRYYRSSDARISTSDRRVGQGSVSRLGSDDTSRESVSLTAPSAPGVYYYGACVSGVSNESNTNNNCSAAVAITVQASKPDETAVPDLVVETPTTGTTTLEPGGSFTLNATVRNKGTANSPAPTFRWYRSPNANISINDTEIGSANISSLSAGTTNTQQINLTAPTAAGTYFYGGCVESSIGESDTTNNCSSAITITVQNRAPTKVGTITVPTLSVGDTPVRLDVAPYFSDLNDDSLTYTVSSSDTNVVSAETSGVSGSNLNIHPIAEGNATITVTASDGELTATQTFSVTVNPISNTISSNTTLITQAHTILALAFNPNQGSNTLAFGSADNLVQLWNTDTAIHQRTLQGHTNYVLNVAFSPDGKILASGDANGTVNVWNAHTGNLNYTLRRHTNSVFGIAFSPDGQTLASGSLDGTIRLWDPATGQSKSVLTGNLAPVLTVAFSPDRLMFASGNSDGTIHLWNVNQEKILHTFRGHKDFVLSVAFNHDGSALASGSADSTVQVWNTLTRNLEHMLTEHTDWVNSVAFNPSPGSWTLASGSSDGTVRLWDQNTGTQHSLTEHKNSVESISFSADGNTLASGSADGTVLLWDLTQSPSGQPTLDTEKMEIKEDVNRDGVVNILDLAIVSSLFGTTGDNDADVNEDGVVDIIDLVLVANAFGDVASAPAMRHLAFEYLTPQQVSKWLQEAKALRDTTPEFQRGILVLEQILAMFTPQKTALLPNYPNPFNPETWIPYQLASPADVSISIYAADGKMVRTLDLGNQVVGIYKSRSRAAYWDGKNALGEPVASGVYFYKFTAGDFAATRKMLIRK